MLENKEIDEDELTERIFDRDITQYHKRKKSSNRYYCVKCKCYHTRPRERKLTKIYFRHIQYKKSTGIDVSYYFLWAKNEKTERYFKCALCNRKYSKGMAYIKAVYQHGNSGKNWIRKYCHSCMEKMPNEIIVTSQ